MIDADANFYYHIHVIHAFWCLQMVCWGLTVVFISTYVCPIIDYALLFFYFIDIVFSGSDYNLVLFG
ncbi:putative membrane protein [Candidatus Ichthyocystis hellenicum]|uniref:Putative membrane protein n=1 Tax=Candidatus Ichthyocystis hellenicum TaxID=1561003 RepID=A0A0S4M2A1_9BURK|nr:putative membrane protein [Candidatus Ichthyocystis hellenicum]